MKRFERKLYMASALWLATVTAACGSGDGTAPDPTSGSAGGIKLNGVILKGHGASTLGDLASGSAELNTKSLGAYGERRDILSIAPVDDGASLECPSPVQCFTIRANDANITHVFIDVDAPCASNPRDFSVRVGGPDGALVPELHDTGGPCGGLDRDVWFPLTGNPSWAVVCVAFDGFVPERVSVGAKANDDCEQTKNQAHRCDACTDGGSSEAGVGDSGGGGGPVDDGGSAGAGGEAGSGGDPCDPPPVKY